MEKFSTGLRNQMLAGRGLREIFSDAVINVYTGTAPAEANDAPTGTLLLQFSKSGGAVSVGEASTPEIFLIDIDGSDHDTGDIIVLNWTIDGGTETVTYTYGTDWPFTHVGGDDLGLGLANAINKQCPSLMAISVADGTDKVMVTTRKMGQALVLLNTTGTTGTLTSNASTNTAARSDALSFGKPSAGVISKEAAETWSDTVIASGTAGYFRLVASTDLGTDNTTDPRIQGLVSTSGAEINASSAVLTIGSVITLDSFAITFPES